MSEIEFRMVASGHYRHDETGIEIKRVDRHREHGYNVGTRWHLLMPMPVGTRDLGSTRTLAAAKNWAAGDRNGIVQVRQVRMAEAHAAALVEDAERFPEVIHHVSRYGNKISCGATGPVRVEEIAMRVTCESCKTADYAALVAEAERQAYAEDAEDAERSVEYAGAHVFRGEDARCTYPDCNSRPGSVNHVRPGRAALDRAHAEALTENAERDSFAQLYTWAARHDLPSGRRHHIESAIAADHAEALRMNGGGLVDATALNLVDRIEEPSGASVGMFRDLNAFPVDWPRELKEAARSIACSAAFAAVHLVSERASAFEGAPPVRSYSDGSQLYGPYVHSGECELAPAVAPRPGPAKTVQQVRNAVLDALDATGDHAYPLTEQEPVRRPFGAPAIAQTHYSPVGTAAGLCPDWNRRTDVTSNDSTNVDCLTCLTRLAEVREARLPSLAERTRFVLTYAPGKLHPGGGRIVWSCFDTGEALVRYLTSAGARYRFMPAA